MSILLVTLIAVIFVSWLLMHYGPMIQGDCDNYVEISGAIMCIVSGIGVIAYAIAFIFWLSASYKVDIINSEYCTNYTLEQFFWANHTIEQTIKNQCS